MNGPLARVLPPRGRTGNARFDLHRVQIQLPAEAVELLPAHVACLRERLTKQDLALMRSLEAHYLGRTSRSEDGEGDGSGPVPFQGRNHLANSRKGYHLASKGGPRYADPADTEAHGQEPGSMARVRR